jgi:hypothetical protein
MTCEECSQGFLRTGPRDCVALNPLCRSYGPSGECTGCYQGYGLVAGNCVSGGSDPGCKTYDAQGVCRECANRYYWGPSGRCTQIDDLC